MSRKIAEFDALVGDLERLVTGGTSKVAEDQSSSETTVEQRKSDDIVDDMHPDGVEDVEPAPGDELSDVGVHIEDGKPEGHPTPSVEEHEKTLTSPSSKIASAQEDPFMSLLLEVRDEVGISSEQRKVASKKNDEALAISEDTADAISRKIAQYAADQEYGRRLVESPLHRKVAELSGEGYSNEQIAGWIYEQGLVSGFNKAAEDLASVDPTQQAVAELEALVESGEISPEEAVEAAAEIDAAMEESGIGEDPIDGGMPEGMPEGSEDPVMAASEVLLGLVEEGQITEEEALEAAAEIDEELGGSAGEGEDVEAVAAEVLAEFVESGEISPEEAEEAAIEIDAILSGEDTGDLEGAEELEDVDEEEEPEVVDGDDSDDGDEDEDADEGTDETRKSASGANWWNFKVASRSSVEDVFDVMDHLCERGVLTERQAVDVLNSAQAGDSRKLAAALEVHNSIVEISRKVAQDPAQDPAAAQAAPAAPNPADPAAPAAPAAPGAEGGGDPTAAIDQLLGALEQLVALGVVQEDTAVQAVQNMGLIPDDAAAGGAPPQGGPAGAPAPQGAVEPGGQEGAPMPPVPSPDQPQAI